jgi:hypothetical protein
MYISRWLSVVHLVALSLHEERRQCCSSLAEFRRSA